MKKIILALFFALVSVSSIYSQNEIGPALSSQLFSRINFNPAGMGNDGDINIFNMNRMQWAGFEGAPTYTLVNIHSFVENIKSGFGGVFSYDQLGIANKAINAKFVYCYSIDLSEKSLISFGASAGMLKKQNNFSIASGHLYDVNDVLPVESFDMTQFDSDFGIEFSTPYFLLGGSINHLGMMDSATIFSPTQAYYGYIRGMFPVSQSVTITPSVLYMNSGMTNVIDVNTVVFINEAYWAGLSYRIGAGIAAMVGLEWKFLRVGYSYEYSLGPTTINSNTHELMLSLKIGTKSSKATPAKGKGKKKKR